MQVADVEWHCPEQGVPVKVSDPRTLSVVADVLLAGRRKRDAGER